MFTRPRTPQPPQPRSLALGFCELTDAGLKELATLKSLQTLDLTGLAKGMNLSATLVAAAVAAFSRRAAAESVFSSAEWPRSRWVGVSKKNPTWQKSDLLLTRRAAPSPRVSECAFGGPQRRPTPLQECCCGPVAWGQIPSAAALTRGKIPPLWAASGFGLATLRSGKTPMLTNRCRSMPKGVHALDGAGHGQDLISRRQ